MFTITKSFIFSASHQLSGLPESHPCSKLHGHNFEIIFELADAQLDRVGFVKDYRELEFVKMWIDKTFDHRHLNNVLPDGINPTAEYIAYFVFEKFKYELKQLISVTVKETEKTSATYVGKRN